MVLDDQFAVWLHKFKDFSVIMNF